MGRRVALWCWVLGAASACGDDPGDLDPEVVAALTITEGNAVGFQRTGSYRAELDVVECTGCEAILELGGQGACSIGALGALTDQVQALQTDGVLLLEYRDLYGVGPLDDDGAFAVGSVADLSNALAELDVVLRIDGAFDEDDPGRFSALVRQRTHGETTAGDVLDCYEAYEITAERL